MPEFPIADTLTREQSLAAPYLPGFQRGEQLIAKTWLATRPPSSDAFGFNVRIGQGVEAPADVPEFARRFVLKTTQKRIDIVEFHAGTVSLWEVKIQANLGALGQMLGYRHLWERQFPAWAVKDAGVLCHLIAPDTAAVYAKHGMPFYLFAEIELPPLEPLPAS